MGTGLVARRLTDLRPEWIAHGRHRYGMGVRFLCPGHPHARHSIELWFLNPCDGDPPLPPVEMKLRGVRTLHRRFGADLAELTVTVPGDVYGSPLDLRPHWTGYVLEGDVYDAPGDEANGAPS